MARFEVPQKRPRPSSRAPTPSQSLDPIVISSDESDTQPPVPKRQKSTPPVTNGSHSSALLQLQEHAAAKTAESAAKLTSLMKMTPSASVTQSRDASTPKRDVAHKKSSPFNFPSWTMQAERAKASQSPETSRNTKASSAQPALSRNRLSDSKSRKSTPSEPRSSVGPRIDSRFSTPSALTKTKASTPSPHTMRDPKYDPLEADSKSTNAEGDKPSDRDTFSEDEDGEIEILAQFQKLVPMAAASSGVSRHFAPSQVAKTREPNVQVAVPLRPTPSPAKSQKPSTVVPNSSQTFSVNIPLDRNGVSTSYFQAEKNAVFQKLKKSTDIATTNLPEVEKYFGQTGFSKAFDTNEYERKMKAAPIFKRKVDRSKVNLDDFRKLDISPDDEESKERKRNMTDREAAGKMPDEMLKEIMDEIFNDHPDPPLTFRNDINERRTPGNFQFMDRYVIRETVKTAPATSNWGCNCESQCIPEQCACLMKVVRVDPFDPTNKATFKKTIRTYYQHPDDPSITVLRPEFIASELEPSNQHYEITECNDLCGCGPSCWNRVVGRGRTLSLEIYMTEHCGFGVRCPGKDILKGQFIDLYLGEVITQGDVEYRESAKHPEAPSYVYNLDWFSPNNCYVVDGEFFGSPMRFVNHCCSPNARSFAVQTHHGDKHVYSLAFFAIKDIPAGEQITIDYHPQSAQVEKDDDDSDEEENPASTDVSMSGSDVVQVSHGTSGKASKAWSKATSKASSDAGGVKPKPRRADLKPAPVVEAEEGRSRCYCGANNCRIWLWSGPGRKRKRRYRQDL